MGVLFQNKQKIFFYEINVRNLMLVGIKIYILDVMFYIGMIIYIYKFYILCEKVVICIFM